MKQSMEKLIESVDEMVKGNRKMLRCTEILTSIIQRGKRGASDEKFCITHITKQEVLELTELGREG